MEVTYTGNTTVFQHEHGSARATPHPGTGEIYHVHGFYVNFNQRNRGFGSQYHKERLDLFIADPCVTTLTCIVAADNVAELKIMKKFGWEQLKAFRNTSGEALFLFSKDVR